MSATRALAAAAALSALLAISGALAWPPLLFVFKPVTTLLVIAHAGSRGAATPRLRGWVLAGLVLSLAGDVALLWPQQGFLPGLVAFLFAHIAYLVAFTRDTRFAARRLPFVLYAGVAGAVLVVLWPGVPPALRAPVLLYVVALAAMAAQAAARWRAHRHTPAGATLHRAALGGALFMASDAMIAFDRFHAPLPAAPALILASYWLAQWCIASALTPRQA